MISTNTFSRLSLDSKTIQKAPWCNIFVVDPKRDHLSAIFILFYRTESSFRLDPSRQFHVFCDHTGVLWFNPITRQAQRGDKRFMLGFVTD